MASDTKNRKRRSQYGNRLSLSAPSKSFRHSVTDRVKYRYKSSEDDGNRTYHPDSLILILQYTWNLYRVSSLYNIEYSTVKLKQYAARIKQELMKNITDTANDVSFNVKVQILPELEESNNDSHSLQIDVFYKKEENEPVLKYRGVILCLNNSHESNILTQFPLLLCIGAQNITRIVHKTLSYLFDTLLFPLRISEDDLMWLSAMLSDSTNNKKIVSYDYSLPGCAVKNPISVSMTSTLINKLWNTIHKPESEEISYQEVQNYHKCIQDQLEGIYGIKFKLLKLSKITMSDATIACEGKIKIFSEDAVVKILSFISDVSLLLDNTGPEMSVEHNNVTL